MKSKFSKIIIFALAALMLFGTFSSSAYESYDTYTYSIDGKPLASPHAYTPDITSYKSDNMGLLDGNYWHYDSTNDIVIWPQKETIDGIKFVGKLGYELKADGTYSVVSYAKDDIAELIEVITAITDSADKYLAKYPKQDGENVVDISISATDIINRDGSFAEVDELINEFKACVDDKINEVTKTGAKVYISSIDLKSIRSFAYELLGLSKASIEIPAEYDRIPVTEIAAGFLKVPESVNSNAIAKNVYTEVYGEVTNFFIGKNLELIGEDALAGVKSISAIYYEGETLEGKDDERGWNEISISENDSKIIGRSTVYCYSLSEKFGNSALSGASDIVSDHKGNIYIADKNNNRIVVLNHSDLKVKGIISTYVDENNMDRTLNTPSGLYVTNPDLMVDGSENIYVCNTGNKDIVVFDKDFNYVKTIKQPPIAGMLDENEFVPSAIAVDKYGRIFVVSKSCYKGIIVMSNQGVFTGFIGAQKVTTDIFDQIWKSFQSLEQKQSSVLQLPDPFNNLTVDDDGFVYATINFSEESDRTQQLANIKTKLPTYSPVKKLNSMGVEIMKRKGFFDPGGEVIDSLVVTKDPQPVSKIIDVAIGDEGTWTILDAERQRTFTYDQNGNLLFAFGNAGNQIGNTVGSIAITYQALPNPDETEYEDYTYNLVILDKGEMGEYLTVYHPTEYCEMIMKALHNENNHNYNSTINYWQDVLTRNNNFDLAYIGIGKALYNQGEYEEAMKMLKSAYEVEYYSKAFAAVRKEFISKWMLPLVIGIIILLVLIFKFLGYAKKRNKATALKVGKKTFTEELLYVFHLIFHPFDGFWDLKHEKRGSIRAATTILALTVIAFFYQAIGTGYIQTQRTDYESSTILFQVISVLVPVLLWVIGNWCLTTLFDGEGSLKDIYIATCYAIAPLPIFIVISTILSNVLVQSELSIITLLVSIGFIWAGILLFFGMVVTHDYTSGKNVITILGTIAAMAVIIFIILLFSSLVMKMISFIIALFTEIFDRVV